MAIQTDTLKIFQATDVTLIVRDVADADGHIINWQKSVIIWGLTTQEGRGEILLLKEIGQGIEISKDGASFAILLADSETESLNTGKYYHEIKAQSPAGQNVQILAPSLLNIAASALPAAARYDFVADAEYSNPVREYTGQITEVWRDESSTPGAKILDFKIFVPKNSVFQAGDMVEATITTDIAIDQIEIQSMGAGILQVIDIVDIGKAEDLLSRVRALNASLINLKQDITELENKE